MGNGRPSWAVISHFPSNRPPCSLTEDGGADPHHRRALGNRLLDVVGHAHGQGIRRNPLIRVASLNSRNSAKRLRSKATSSVGSGIHIRPRRRSRGSAATASAKAGRSAGETPLLLASPLTLTCRQTFRGPSGTGRCADSRAATLKRSTEVPSRNALPADASCCSGSGR